MNQKDGPYDPFLKQYLLEDDLQWLRQQELERAQQEDAKNEPISNAA